MNPQGLHIGMVVLLSVKSTLLWGVVVGFTDWGFVKIWNRLGLTWMVSPDAVIANEADLTSHVGRGS